MIKLRGAVMSALRAAPTAGDPELTDLRPEPYAAALGPIFHAAE
jgi:hypothetical protein